MKKTSTPKSIESLGYIKCHSSSCPKTIKDPSHTIKYNCQNISSWTRKLETILEIRKKATFLKVINSQLFISFSKILLTTERRLTEQQFLVVDLSSLLLLNICSWDETTVVEVAVSHPKLPNWNRFCPKEIWKSTKMSETTIHYIKWKLQNFTSFKLL